MKKVIVAFSLVLGFNLFSAQAWNGTADQKVQIGLGAWGNGTGITGTYDYGISNLLSVGAGANLYFDNYKDDNKDNRFFIFGRLNAHLQEPLGLPEQWDIYPGLDLGLLGNTFGLGAHIGVRYFFNDKFGAFLEAGNNGSLGVSINL
ncbi:hypothetical protein MHJ94_00755 [Chryseobacterium taklimakanense]|uniref:Outer membrane protein beta-barrel domain-containing protein n=1 Tax=Chryseobacterium taklimakanense TaxID=536441 RepID=A0A239XIN3_9FLAO|nr:DUF6646 family protein [Chryseobacterium taklimakanense]MCG7279822.1 hypothetical protein [Chryseobacterium taklimakanense]SNV46517.1 Uncharacterised protein [Chryseobacterium taklimakanense]